MSMQIKAISLYGKNHERRDVILNTHKVNIITGASKKGKSSLIDIVEYCLGSSECNVAKGRITETVSWYAVKLQFPDSQVFIARSAPLEGKKSSTSCHLLVAKEVSMPSFGELESSTNVDAVVKFLTSKVGIAENVTEVPENQTRNNIHIGFKHSRFYLFQSQDEIANKRTLFHRQAEPHIPQAIKDTLPYFMGAAEDDRLAELDNLRSLKRERTRLLKRIKEVESLRGDGLQRGYALLAEAANFGLATANVVAGDDQLIDALKHIAYGRQKVIEEQEIEDGGYLDIELKYKKLTEEKKLVRAKLKDAENYSSTMSGFEGAIQEQYLRLKSIGLYKDSKSRLVASDGEIGEEDSVESIIYKSINSLSDKLEGVNRNRPRLASYISSLREKDAQLAQEIKRYRGALEAMRQQEADALEKAALDERRSRVAGRISLYVESVDFGEEDLPSLKSHLETLTGEISSLEEKLDPALLKERLDSQLSCVSEDMTRWARELGLEHSEYPIRLDASALTVVAETPMGRTPLNRMGSGENWIGYHLVAYLALAKWFIEQNRPVGRFIFFDQPTQVYFPSEKSVTGSLDEIEKDEDREAVRKMFEWIFKTVGELSPGLQVIITDHADIDAKWFQDAVVDNKWRGDEALIPLHWYQ